MQIVIILFAFLASLPSQTSGAASEGRRLQIATRDSLRADFAPIDLPDTSLMEAYREAAERNVLRALNPKVFFGYWSVCADGQGFGYGNTYPSLDGQEMSDALLWLGRDSVVQANWAYVRSFQRSDGLLPLAILPSLAGKTVGQDTMLALVLPGGGLYHHWVPGNPLEATASVTYIQNADLIYRHTLDRRWLLDQLPSVNLAADYLDSLTSPEGMVGGGGFYVERPPRISSDGVTQCYAARAFHILSGLNKVAGDEGHARRYDELSRRIRGNFIRRFWAGDHFAEYFNPEHGFITDHGLTDADWAAIATGMAGSEEQEALWARLKEEKHFYYGGMPTGISTRPESYQAWEFTVPDRHDLSSMGRVWYLEAWARARMGDAEGLLDGLYRVVNAGRANHYFWRERYQDDGKGGLRGLGPNTYCEYPANLIRIVQEFLLGVEMRLDGSLMLAPTLTEDFWKKGFGETLNWGGRRLQYYMDRELVQGSYAGRDSLRLSLKLPDRVASRFHSATVGGMSFPVEHHEGMIELTIPPSKPGSVCTFRTAAEEGE